MGEYDHVRTNQEYVAERFRPEGVDYETAYGRVSEFLDLMQTIESGGWGDNFMNAYNPETKASGPYQYKVEGKNNSFDTAVKRAITTHGRYGTREVPEYLRKAKKHRDPFKLTYQQIRDLAIGDLYQMKPRTDKSTGKMARGTTELFTEVMRGGRSGREAAMELYGVYHHTKPEVVNYDPRILKIMGLDVGNYEIPESPYYEGIGPALGFKSGGFIRPNPGRKLI